jgi:DNA-directed RNA polymerase subunit alpha
MFPDNNLESLLKNVYRSQVSVPSNFEVQDVQTSDHTLQSDFVIYPVHKTFSNTLANAFRRTMLSSICGTKICGFSFSGLSHQYTYHPAIKEDLLIISRNLKQVVFEMAELDASQFSFLIKKTGSFCAGDLQLPSNIKLINPNLHLFSVVSLDQEIKLTIKLASNIGFIRAVEGAKTEDIVSLDCFFSPVLHVSYEVCDYHKDTSSLTDMIKMSVTTNGSIKPSDCLRLSTALLREYCKVFVNFNEISFQIDEKKTSDIDNLLSQYITELDLSVRSRNCLTTENITFIGELVQKTESEMLKTPNFGKKSLDEIKEVLQRLNLSLGMKVENWTPPSRSNDSKN